MKELTLGNDNKLITRLYDEISKCSFTRYEIKEKDLFPYYQGVSSLRHEIVTVLKVQLYQEVRDDNY